MTIDNYLSCIPFIFISLNISCISTRCAVCPAMVASVWLSCFCVFRISCTNLYEANKNQISLEHEIQFLENYIALMKLRYIDNLNIRTEFPVVVPCVQIPPLLFISLLENAFKHGVSYQEPSFIEVRIELADEGVIFNCKNSKHTHAHKDAYHGIGIDNIKKRLHLLYGNNYTFTTNESENCFEVLLIIPFLS